MRRMRIILAVIVILVLAPTLGSTSRARAGGHIGTAMTDFTQVTPADAIVYATIQSTSPDQPKNLRRIASVLGAQQNIAGLLGQTFGPDNNNALQVVSQAVTLLSHTFNGELGMALLPPTVTPNPRLHVLLEAGLQPGVTAVQLRGTLALFNLGGAVQPSYRKLPIIRVDLNKLLGSAAGSGTAIPANGPISSAFYGAVAGNDAVLSTDLPTLKRAIDTWYGTSPSVAASSDFQSTVGALPSARMLTLYTHLDTRLLSAVIGALASSNPSTAASLATLPRTPGTISDAFSLSFETDGILANASPSVSTGSLTIHTGLTPTMAGEPAFLPDDTLAYAAINNLGGLLRTAIETAGPAVLASGKQGTSATPRADPIKTINQSLGLDLDKDVFSWMHGDASIALLPVGSSTFGTRSPLARLSVVATLKETDKGFVEAKLAKISAVLQKQLGPAGAVALHFVDVPGPSTDPLHILAVTPNGIGYTYYHGYLMLGSALPADIAAVQRGNSGHNLATSPLYRAALNHVGTVSYGSVLFVNLTRLRETLERVAVDSGMDLGSYNQAARPLLTALKSLALVSYAGPNGGGALFIGISR